MDDFEEALGALGIKKPSPASAVPSHYMRATSYVESRNNPDAVSPKGARGSMQVMDATNKDPGYGVTPAQDNSKEERVRVGQDLLGAFHTKYKDPALASIAYNMGPGATDEWIKNGSDARKLPVETFNYVKNVMSTAAAYQKQDQAAVNKAPAQPAPTQPAPDGDFAAAMYAEANHKPEAVAPKEQSSIAQTVASAMPTPGVKLGSMLAQKYLPSLANKEADTSTLADFGKRMGAGAVSLGDTVANGVGGMVKQVEYAGARAFGKSPDEATKQSNSGIGASLENPVSKFVNSAGKLITGTDPKIEESAGYKSEASQKAMQFVGENIAKGADWISGKTGLPKADVENMMNTALVGVTPVAGKVAGKAVQKTARTVDAFNQELAGKKPLSSLLDAGKPAAAQYGSVGASGANIMTRIGAASEEVKADAMAQIKEAKALHGKDWGDHIHWEALNRHLNADALAIPGRLTNAQATQDAALTAQQWNERGKNGMEPVFDMQNKVMADNLKDIREKSTPDVYGNSHAEYSDTAIAAYKKLHAEEKGSIQKKWTNIIETTSDKTIFDAEAMLKDAEAELVKRKLTTHDPDGQLTELKKSVSTGGMSADEFVNWRQNLGRAAMKGGNEGSAASAILNATNKSRLHPDAEHYRGIVNEALAEGKALHDKIDNDPAYKAIADRKASRDDFVQKYVINGKSEKLAVMRDNLAHDDIAGQSLRAAVLDHIRGSAGLNNEYKGTFGAVGFNKSIDSMKTRGREIFKEGELERLGAVGQYAADAKFNSASSTKNWSNTHSAAIATPGGAALAKVGEMAGNAAEGLLAAKTGGLSSLLTIPYRAASKEKAKAKAAAAEKQAQDDYFHKATRPAAGLIK